MKFQCLDKFYGKWLHQNEKFKCLCKVMVFVFTLSHGQSQVEYGFTINDDLVENLKAESIYAQHIVYDYIKASGKGVYELAIDNALVFSCKTAHSKYTNPLKNAKNCQKQIKMTSQGH